MVITFEPQEMETSYLACIVAYSTSETLSNDFKANDLNFVSLNLTFILKIAIWTLLPPGASVFHKNTRFWIRINFKNQNCDEISEFS